MTECLVTVCGQPDAGRRQRFVFNNIPYEVDTVIPQPLVSRQLLQRINASICTNSLVLFFGCSDRSTAKTLLQKFCEDMVQTSPTSFCRITITTGETLRDDIVQFEFDRLDDAEPMLEDTLSDTREISCRLISAGVTVTSATSDSFEFRDSRVTVLFCSSDDAEELPKLVDCICHQLKIIPQLVMVHLHAPEEKLLQSCVAFRGECRTETFGIFEPASTASRFHDIRSWTFKINETSRFTPTSPGSYFVNLHAHLAVGDKVVHQIHSGISFIVSNSTDASKFDFVLSSLPTDCVHGQHCRLRNENGMTFIRPETGLVYVNGILITDERELYHSDRVVLGSEVMLRFAVVSSARGPSEKYFVDWDVGVTEMKKAQQATEDVTVDRVEELEALLQSKSTGACIVLTNPPETYNDSTVWCLEDFPEGEAISIGPNLSISVPFLKHRATLVKDSDGYTLSTGSTVKRLFHGGRFVVGEALFLINDMRRRRRSDKIFAPPSADFVGPMIVSPSGVVELRNELYDLQWSISSLFDFTFPIPVDASGDAYMRRRKQLGDDSTITGERFSLTVLSSTLQLLTESIRMIGSQISMEVNSPNSDVNMGLLRLLHDRSRTIDQLLLGTESTSAVNWGQLESLQRTLGMKLIRVENLQNELEALRPQTFSLKEDVSSVRGTGSPAALQILKAQIMIPSPIVARRWASTIEAVHRSGSVRLLWDRYCRDLDGVIEASGGAHNILPVKQQSVHLALLDVVAAFEVGVRQGWIVQGDRAFVEKRLVTWQIVAEQCAGSFFKPAPPGPQVRGLSPMSRMSPSTSSRQPSPVAVSRGSSRDRAPPARKPSPVASTSLTRSDVAPQRTARTPSPLQKAPMRVNSPSSLSKSPAAFKPRDNSTTTPKALTPRAAFPLMKADIRGAPVRQLSPLPTERRQVVPAPKSPKTTLTKQLMDLELGHFKRRP